MAHTGYVTSCHCRHTQSCGVPLLIDYDSIRNMINCVFLGASCKALKHLKEINRLFVILTVRQESWRLSQDTELDSLGSSFGRNFVTSTSTQAPWPIVSQLRSLKEVLKATEKWIDPCLRDCSLHNFPGGRRAWVRRKKILKSGRSTVNMPYHSLMMEKAKFSEALSVCYELTLLVTHEGDLTSV
jgi:hypothetical protein